MQKPPDTPVSVTMGTSHSVQLWRDTTTDMPFIRMYVLLWRSMLLVIVLGRVGRHLALPMHVSVTVLLIDRLLVAMVPCYERVLD